MIRNSYIFDNTVIGPNCVIDQSIIGANVNVREGTTIEKGCLVADGVVVGPKAVLQAFDRVSRKKENTSISEVDTDGDVSEEDDEDSELGDIDQGKLFFVQQIHDVDVQRFVADLDNLAVGLGAQTNAFVWPRRVSDPEDTEVDELEGFNNQRLMRLGKRLCVRAL
jgi:translation initiation factor eIF-2B subunit epsilon